MLVNRDIIHDKKNIKTELPKSINQFESLLQTIFKKNPNNHYLIRILEDYLQLDELLKILGKYEKQIEAFRRNKSVVILSTDYDYEQLPDFIPIAPTEEEAVDIIDFEEIERDLLMEE